MIEEDPHDPPEPHEPHEKGIKIRTIYQRGSGGSRARRVRNATYRRWLTERLDPAVDNSKLGNKHKRQ